METTKIVKQYSLHALLQYDRWMVIALYPGIHYGIGGIIEVEEGKHSYWSGEHTEIVFEDYPHIFRKMGWWEKRLIEDMPTFVKVSSLPKIGGSYHLIGDCLQVLQWTFAYLPVDEKLYIGAEANGRKFDPTYLIPITEAEYTDAAYKK